MPSHAAFLRAVNLGSTRKAGSADLRAAFEEAGFGDVATFRNSGNVVFSTGSRAGPAKLAERIEDALAETLGFEVPTFVRDAAQLRAIAEYQPFSAAAVDASRGKLQVALLHSKPTAKDRKAVVALAGDRDRLALPGTELYWLPSGGTQQSSLDMKTIDRLLGPMTMRTQGTISQLRAKFFS
jgi:uncharacterized protein (DUF1697 family)